MTAQKSIWKQALFIIIKLADTFISVVLRNEYYMPHLAFQIHNLAHFQRIGLIVPLKIDNEILVVVLSYSSIKDAAYSFFYVSFIYIIKWFNFKRLKNVLLMARYI